LLKEIESPLESNQYPAQFAGKINNRYSIPAPVAR